MPGETSAVRYTTTAIFLHWAGAILILAGAALGLVMVELALSPRKLQWYSYHKWIGLTVFLIAVARLAWRVYRPAPPFPASVPAWQQSAAIGMQFLLFLLMLTVPVLGWLHSSATGVQVVYFGVLPLPDLVERSKELAELLRLLHRNFVFVMLAAIAIHAGAALKHHLVDRDQVLARMLPFLKTGAGNP